MTGDLPGTVGAARRWGRVLLEQAGVEAPELDADLLIAHLLGSNRGHVIAHGDRRLDPAQAGELEQLVQRRAAREPLAYITGSKGFRRIELKVDRHVLIPRPDSEVLVAVAKVGRPCGILDVATGSGAVALALADEMPDAGVTATDISPAALTLASRNAEALGLADRVEFVESDLLEAVEGAFDCITANLPYVTESEWQELQPEIVRYEPRLALVGGRDGLDLVRRLIPAARGHLKRGGMLALEIGDGQAGRVAELMSEAGYRDVERHADLAGIERVVSGRL